MELDINKYHVDILIGDFLSIDVAPMMFELGGWAGFGVITHRYKALLNAG